MVDMTDTDTQRVVAREFWAGHLIDGRAATWDDMTSEEKTHAITAHAERHKPAPVRRLRPSCCQHRRRWPVHRPPS
jgi:hypothetical protein